MAAGVLCVIRPERRYVPLGDGLSYEAALLLTAATPTDDSTTLQDLGMSWRSPRAAIVESVAGDETDRGGEQLGDPVA